jgi:tetratricopeptide (TPR) repeat protein
LNLKEWDKAINSFNRALDQLLYATPQFALNNLGEAYRGKKDYERSIEYYRKALHADPRYFRAHRGLGVTYMAMGDHDMAISSLKKAVEYAPRFAPTHYDLGRAYVAKYNREKALSAFRKVVELVPDSPLADAASAEISKLQR